MNNNLNNLLCCQKKLINILKEFNKICINHNISYFCFERTLTGIIKNNGWLEFSIDIDVAMSNYDYNIFNVLAFFFSLFYAIVLHYFLSNFI